MHKQDSETRENPLDYVTIWKSTQLFKKIGYYYNPTGNLQRIGLKSDREMTLKTSEEKVAFPQIQCEALKIFFDNLYDPKSSIDDMLPFPEGLNKKTQMQQAQQVENRDSNLPATVGTSSQRGKRPASSGPAEHEQSSNKKLRRESPNLSTQSGRAIELSQQRQKSPPHDSEVVNSPPSPKGTHGMLSMPFNEDEMDLYDFYNQAVDK